MQRDLPLRWVLAAALGAQGFGHDFRYGTIRPAILAFPRRSNIVTGRAAAAGITASVTALTATAITMSLLVPTTTIEPGVLTDLRLWRSIALGVITPGLVAAVAAGLTAITRNYAAALTLLAGWILAVELMSYTPSAARSPRSNRSSPSCWRRFQHPPSTTSARHPSWPT